MKKEFAYTHTHITIKLSFYCGVHLFYKIAPTHNCYCSFIIVYANVSYIFTRKKNQPHHFHNVEFHFNIIKDENISVLMSPFDAKCHIYLDMFVYLYMYISYHPYKKSLTNSQPIHHLSIQVKFISSLIYLYKLNILYSYNNTPKLIQNYVFKLLICYGFPTVSASEMII